MNAKISVQFKHFLCCVAVVGMLFCISLMLGSIIWPFVCVCVSVDGTDIGFGVRVCVPTGALL